MPGFRRTDVYSNLTTFYETVKWTCNEISRHYLMTVQKKPSWLKRRLPSGPEFERTHRQIRQLNLHTVCQEANCPNIFECFSQQTATFLILGDICTRDCSFCAVRRGSGEPLDLDEPRRVAAAALEMGLRYVVLTSVTRDDLPDGGAEHYAQTIQAVRCAIEDVSVEVLIPDFQGNQDALLMVLSAGPSVLNHNLETVPRLYPEVRPQADYRRSLALLAQASAYAPHIPVKSGLMLGLGETPVEIEQALLDLRASSCRILTLGQYLQPSPAHYPIKQFVTPETFERWRITALDMGFDQVASGPFVRSSYHAKEVFHKIKK
jgi:lipoic acid synthetase